MLRIDGVSHAYGDVVSLRHVGLTLEPGEILCLLGPSGCGKTTLLRIVAGLETDFEGSVSFNGEDLRGIPAHRRGFGFMFQDFALFPHMSVAENVAYGLKRRGYSGRECRERAAALLDQVGLAGQGERDVSALSGGQKQRVALARSLGPHPRLLMLDEPLGSIDAQLRDQLALDLRQIIKREALSAIYVTHDHREAYAVSDRIAVMNIGSVQQHDKPRALYHNPTNSFVARFLGLPNIFPISADSPFMRFKAYRNAPSQGCSAALIHPAGIYLEREPPVGAEQFEATLSAVVFRGDYLDVRATLASGPGLSFAAPELKAGAWRQHRALHRAGSHQAPARLRWNLRPVAGRISAL